MFHINIESKAPSDCFGETCQLCKIQIGNFVECFHAPIDYWTIDKYENQWIEGVTRILTGSSKSFLVSAMRDPNNSNFISIFSLYASGKQVFAQNRILLCEEHGESILNNEIINLIEERATETEDGDKISEWETTIDSLNRFLESKG